MSIKFIFMKKLAILVASISMLFIAAGNAKAGYVNGYFKSNGTYVDGYYRSDPNGLKYDNYSWSPGDDLYNSSYYDYDRPSSWRTPAWETQDDYFTGLESYKSNNDYDGWFSNDYGSNSYSDYSSDYSYPSLYDSTYDYDYTPSYNFDSYSDYNYGLDDYDYDYGF